VVVAGLERLAALGRERWPELRAAGFVSRLLDSVYDNADRGRQALTAILPSECVQPSPRQNRRYDASLLFLVHPLGVVQGGQAAQILADIDRFLTGGHGIRRYLGDSYWAPDYDRRLAAADWTRDYSEDVEVRDGLLDDIGQEAQWCTFDPLLSDYHGRRYRETGSAGDKERQAYHLARALGQIDAQWRCPELYFLRDGQWVANPHTPLLWTQANLSVALAARK
jgi:phosphorylase kinase alpha/beta subunit